MQRHGYTEECYFDFTFTPIYGESGKVEGIFNAVVETTYRVINERRSTLLQKLSDVINAVKSKEEVFAKTSEVLDSGGADVSFYALYVVNPEGQLNLKACSKNYIEQSWPLDSLPDTIVHIANLTSLGISNPPGYWPEAPREAILSPLRATDGSLFGYLFAGLSARRKYDKDYKSFFESLCGVIAGELNTIKALEEQTHRAEALAQIDKAKTIFFSNISHEFRTPLTLILSPLESVLESASYLQDQHKNDLQISFRNTLRLQKLVNTLLDFSRIEAGKMSPNFQKVDIGNLTRDLASSFRSAVESAGITYDVRIDQIGFEASVDIDMWEKIVLNLISNAFKYTLAGTISVAISERASKVVLEVKDTGIGIKEEDRERIFDRFHRVNNSSGRSQEGTGIGLSLVKELVNLHHGEITVKSAPGVGSTFTVSIPGGHKVESNLQNKSAQKYLPTNTNAAFIAEASQWNRTKSFLADKEAADSSASKPRVLLADDNADMRDYVKRLFADQFDVRAVTNGEDALSVSLEWRPELILSDVMMPKLDGFALLKKLKSNLTTRNIPFIFLSARAGEEAKVEGIQAGADDYLVKPFFAKELLARAHNQILINKVRRETEKQFYNLFLQSPAHIHVMKGPDHTMEFFHPLGRPFVGGRDLTGMKMREALPEIEGQGYFEMLDQVYHEGKSFFLPESKASFPAQDGTINDFYFNITYLPWRDVDGKIQGVLQFSFDVTEQAKAHLKLRESEERFRLLATSIPQVVWIATGEGRIEYLSDQWERYTGQSASAGLLNFSDFVHEADRKRLSETWAQSMEKKEPWHLEYRLKNSRGEFRWFSGHTLPLLDENGKVVKWIGSATDIQGQKTANEELESLVAERTQELLSLNKLLQSRNNELSHARSFLQTVLDSSVELIMAFDLDLNYTFINKRAKELAPRNSGDLIGKNVLEVDPDFEKTDEYQQLQRALRGEVIHLDSRRPYVDDKLVLETFVSPLRANGNIVGVLTMHRDITALVKLTAELKRSNQELMRSNEDLQQFAHVTSHDLKEPVRKIKMYENLLRTNYGNSIPEKGMMYLDKIENAASRISSMIEGILRYSSVDAVQQSVEVIDLNTLVQNIIDDLEIPVNQSGAIVRTSHLPIVQGSHTLLYQLFYNILNNALKFVKKTEKPVVDIVDKSNAVGSEFKDYIRIDISDNGIGFDQSYADKIFDSFLRLNPKDKFEGTGLGLALCKKIAERHKGFIRAHGEVNVGASFSVYLPKIQ